MLKLAVFNLLGLLVGLHASTARSQPIVTGSHAARIDSMLTNIVPFGFSGAIAIEKGGELILRKAYGLADRETGAPLSETTPFIIGSLSKQITAAAILKLESEGKLKISDSLGRFWPDAPAATRDITLHQLLSHSSGLPYFSNGSLMEQMPRDKKMRELLQLVPQFTPGAQFMYSNPGYTLLAGVIENASGISFEQYLRDRFFTPLAMNETGFVSESSRWQHGPHSYSDGNDEGQLAQWPEGAEFVGAGNIISTIGDMYKWETALSTDKVLPASARTKLFTAHISTQGKNGYGYGWNVNKTIRNTTVIAHAGDLGGYNSDYRRYTDEGYVMIFLSNAREGGRGYRDAAMNPASLILTGSSIPIAPSRFSLPGVALSTMQGTYSDETSRIYVGVSGENLLLRASDQRSFTALVGTMNDTAIEKLSNSTKQVLEDLSKGEFESLRQLLSPSYPFEDSKVGFAAITRSQEFGELRSIRITGSTFTSPISGRSYYTIEFEKGKRHGSLAWVAGKISGAKDEPDAGLTMLFIPTSHTDFVNVEPFSGKQIHATISDGMLRLNDVELLQE